MTRGVGNVAAPVERFIRVEGLLGRDRDLCSLALTRIWPWGGEDTTQRQQQENVALI